MEQWKLWKYHGIRTRYEISDMGRIHDKKSNLYTYGYPNKDGYMKWTFYLENGKAVSKLVHRLVAKLFVKNPNKAFNVVDHINADKQDNRASNLRWCTNKMNIRYATEMGLMATAVGENSPHHKYTKTQIRTVIEMLVAGKYTKKEIADTAGVHIHTVTDVAYRKIWKEETEGLDLKFIDQRKNFSDDQILNVISMLTGEYTVNDIYKATGVSKIVIRSICNHEIYKEITEGKELSYKQISPRANLEMILKAIQMLESHNYSCLEIQEYTGLTRSVIEKIAYHERWRDLTKGKDLRFKRSKKH